MNALFEEISREWRPIETSHSEMVEGIDSVNRVMVMISEETLEIMKILRGRTRLWNWDRTFT